MQDRYAGDVGDFGKFGMLRCMEKLGLKVGINWYLVGDESHNNDGKHIGYLEDEKYCGCDDELLASLKSMLEEGIRSVSEIEKLNLLNTQKYYHERMIEPRAQVGMMRSEWHQKGMVAMAGCDLVFLDPDNGMLPRSVSRGSDKSIKYVLPEEIMDYYEAGHSVAFYSHRTREQLVVYLERFAELFDEAERRSARIKGITFKRGTVRDYFFILHEEHMSRVENSLERILNSKWSQHFEIIQIQDKKVMDNAKTQENTEVVTESLEVTVVEGEKTDIMEIEDSVIDDLEKVPGTSNEISQQEQNELLNSFAKMRLWLIISIGISVVSFIIAVIALLA